MCNLFNKSFPIWNNNQQWFLKLFEVLIVKRQYSNKANIFGLLAFQQWTICSALKLNLSFYVCQN